MFLAITDAVMILPKLQIYITLYCCFTSALLFSESFLYLRCAIVLL